MISEIFIQDPGAQSFLVKCIMWLTDATASVFLAVVLFTVILKLITLVPDFLSRRSMRKNSLLMEEMRPELEKLQKQYADNKDLYNQKMMAVYKKHGYSMFGACLPTIITIVIFFIAISAFTNYSTYQNALYYMDMAKSYSSVIYEGLDFDKEGKYITIGDDGRLFVNNEYFLLNPIGTIETENGAVNYEVTTGVDMADPTNPQSYFTLTTNSYITYIKYYVVNEQGEYVFHSVNNFKVNADALTTIDGKTFEGSTTEEAVAFLKGIGAERAAETWNNNGAGFLWMKNIWQPDTTMAHPLDTAMFNTSGSCGACASCYNDYNNQAVLDNYADLTAGLEDVKNSPNGYYILVALTALSSLAMQLVTSKSQKAQMELQTVDGRGAQQNKMMTWMMPILMVTFAFVYTAAFSIYITLSSLIGMLTTVVINRIVDKQFKNKKPETANATIRGRVYTPKPQEQKKEQPKKKAKKNSDVPDSHFLRASADKNRRKK